MQTIVINLVAGPGAGKSTITAGIFYRLKCSGIDCEMALEYAKDCVWNESYKNMQDQIYMFGKQYHKIWRLLGKVQVVIVDSPILLSTYYRSFESAYFDNFVVEQYNKMFNVTYFLDRNVEFVQNGRIHNEEQSKEIDGILNNVLHKYNIEHKHVNTTDAIDQITADIVKLVKAE